MKINFNLIAILSIGLLITISSCKKEEPVQLATLTTSVIINITNTSAISGGNISNSGGGDITARGIVWNTSPNPTTANNSTTNGNGNGNYTSNLTGLTANTTYYVRAYATNSAGTAYGNELSFTTGSGLLNPNLTYGSMTDQDGNTYATIVIGTQEWMAENLRTTSYANGDPIPNITNNTQWSNLTTGAWSHYNNDSQYENPYGKLYNWYTVVDTRNVCPTGWHVPSDAEWTVLSDYLGGENVAGGKMKSTGTQDWFDSKDSPYWQYPNTDATNESGFSGLPGGFRYYLGSFYFIGGSGYWWSSTEYDTYSAWYRYLYYFNGDVGRDYGTKGSGFSVRCLRD